MHEVNTPTLAKWPFFVGDAVLLAAAAFLGLRSGAGNTELALAVLCLCAGAVLAVVPFVLEYRAAVKLAESNGLTTAVSTIENLEKVSSQISGATAHWQEAHQNAEKATDAAKQIAEQMTSEVKGFTQFMERMSDREKSMLRLEIEKLHRAESEWLQVLIRMLDHVYALHVGAVRSSQPALIDQVGNFQNACRDVARRVGLAPFTAGTDELFDAQRHQLIDGEPKPQDGAAISETIAAGYTFQGKLVRPALVRLRNGNGH
jgi:molecular chaperone GrpE (heat shock protein)